MVWVKKLKKWREVLENCPILTSVFSVTGAGSILSIQRIGCLNIVGSTLEEGGKVST